MRSSVRWGVVLVVALAIGGALSQRTTAGEPDADTKAPEAKAPEAKAADAPAIERYTATRGQVATEWLATVEHDSKLQTFVDDAIHALRRNDPRLRRQTIRAAVIDLPTRGTPRLVHQLGDSPVYPASVPKFVYLMAALAWRDAGMLEIDSDLDRHLRAMIYTSSNKATQRVVARLTDTAPGPRLSASDYLVFRNQRHAVKRWLAELGVTDLHTVHPTYDGGDISPREEQFLEEPNVPGSLPSRAGAFRNRQAMTANGSVRLLALLATDRALAPASCEEVRRRMQRDVAKQPYLRDRIAGGAARIRGVEVYSKTGTWGPIHADAGIIRHRSGHQVVIAVFVEGEPRYRGPFIADLTDRVLRHLIDAG